MLIPIPRFVFRFIVFMLLFMFALLIAHLHAATGKPHLYVTCVVLVCCSPLIRADRTESPDIYHTISCEVRVCQRHQGIV